MEGGEKAADFLTLVWNVLIFMEGFNISRVQASQENGALSKLEKTGKSRKSADFNRYMFKV